MWSFLFYIPGPLPVEVGESAIRDYLLHNWRHERCAEAATVWFAEHSCVDMSWLPPHLAHVLFAILDLHGMNKNIMYSTLIILIHLVKLGRSITNLSPLESCGKTTKLKSHGSILNRWENDDLPLIIAAMKRHPDEVRIQRAGLQLFDEILGSTHPNITTEVVQVFLQSRKHIFEHLLEIGVIDHLLALLQCKRIPLIHLALQFLWKFCIYRKCPFCLF